MIFFPKDEIERHIYFYFFNKRYFLSYLFGLFLNAFFFAAPRGANTRGE